MSGIRHLLLARELTFYSLGSQTDIGTEQSSERCERKIFQVFFVEVYCVSGVTDLDAHAVG